GHDVNAAAGKCIEVNGQSCDQRFAFTGLHLGDLALMEDHAADKLYVKMAHVQDAASGLADNSKCFFEDLVQCRFEHGIALGFRRADDLFFLYVLAGLRLSKPLLNSSSKLCCPGAKLLVSKLLHLWLERTDALHSRHKPFDFALILGAEYFGDDVRKQK